MRTFASDNNSGAHPRMLEAIAQANVGHARAYGDDDWTRRATERFRALLGREVEVFFVFNGTGANVLGLQAMTRPHHAVLCAEGAHIAVDECGAPERFTGCKLVTVPTPDGKLTPALLEPHVKGVGVEHHVQPRVVSVTQASELGTVYTQAELRALSAFCKARGLRLHMDGARLANAVAALGGDARAATEGVDALSFGGTKNGLLYGEAVVLFDPALAADFRFVRKQGMQLASKMRFVAAQFEAALEDGRWIATAAHANRMAQLLSALASRVPGVEIVQPTQANEVFARLPAAMIAPLQAERYFYVWDERERVVRWVCSWDTSEDDVRSFVAAMERLAGAPRLG